MQYVPPVGGAADDPYIDGNPATGVDGSAVPAAAIEHPQREILALIAAAGLVASGGNLGQLAAAVLKIVQTSQPLVATATGTANAITATYLPAITVLTNGMTVFVRAAAANTGAVTFSPAPGVLAAVAVVKGANAALVAGDVAGAGHWLKMQYDTALTKWVLLNPAKGVSITTVAAASETVSGTVELATIAEVLAGADTVRAVTPAGLAALTSTDTRAGIIEIATPAEVFAGTDTTRAVTPAGLLIALLGAGGTAVTDYFKFPYRDKTTGVRRELIVQIGSVGTLTGNNGLDATFPITFPNAFLAGHVSAVVSTDADGPTVCYRSPTVSGMRINNGTTDTAVSTTYIVIGY